MIISGNQMDRIFLSAIAPSTEEERGATGFRNSNVKKISIFFIPLLEADFDKKLALVILPVLEKKMETTKNRHERSLD